MKKTIWKSILFVFLIPLGAALLLTALYCLFTNMYYEWFWLPEWLTYLPETIADFVVYASVYASLGVVGYFVFYHKAGRAVLMSAIFAATAFSIPFFRYLVRHLCLGASANVVDMLDFFVVDMETSLYLLVTYSVGLFILWAEKAFYCWVIKEKPSADARVISPKNPIGLAMLIYFSAMLVLAVILFTVGGEYSAQSFLALGMEFVINIGGFFLAAFGAHLAGRLAGVAVEKTTR